ncbi:MAG: HAMP domain-containing protein [Deltaproteobacteria bacterium]|nr:HAMP domain-containing protein [Deltaproteobacteria bacterium]
MGTTKRRVLAALVVVALVPLAATAGIAGLVLRRASENALVSRGEPSMASVAREMQAAVEAGRVTLEARADALVARGDLAAAIERADQVALDAALARMRDEEPSLAVASVVSGDGGLRAEVRRRDGRAGAETEFVVFERKVQGARVALSLSEDARVRTAAERARQRVRVEEQRRESFAALVTGRALRLGFGFVVGLTVIVAIAAGTWAVRPLSRRVRELVAALRPVAEGDLTVRVSEDGPADVAELARGMNRMLEQLDRSRARVEFLRRVGQWQNVARRLAHEIKNPLTPIQLAVEECCQQYAGDDPAYRALLATTRDIVVEEVESLRTLVGEFASFARLPRSNLRDGDLATLVRELWPRIERDLPKLAGGRPVSLSLDCVEGPIPVAHDRTMLHRALVNLVANAAQATAEHDAKGEGHVWVHVKRDGEQGLLVVEDDGPGIPEVLRSAVFDPYVTTRKDGTGLGLSIVQKVVLDHGGVVDLSDREGGGARFVVRLPFVGTAPSVAALLRSHASAWGASGSQPGAG